MFKLAAFLFKLVLFTGAVLVLGQIVEWNGKTVSDQIKTEMAQVEKKPSVKKLKTWAGDRLDQLGDQITEPDQRKLKNILKDSE